LSRLERTTHDRQTALEALEEIEKAVQDFKRKTQREKIGK
jgi:hypothetical protein